MMKTLKLAFVLIITMLIAWFVISNYSWVFSKTVEGEVIEIERVNNPTTVVGRVTDAQLHSYAIAIKDKAGEIYTSSTEDRQWAVVKKGYCARATFYRYPFWNLDKGGTFFNARLERLYECQTGVAPKVEAAAPTEAPTAPATEPSVETPAPAQPAESTPQQPGQ